MKRYLESPILRDLGKKIVLLSGPRQCGKTTLSQMLKPDHEYLNHDYAEHRIMINEKSWDRHKSLLILDELHKKKDWKRFLKGIYDVERLTLPIIVTGSARMDTVRRTGDSLAGRFFSYRLHPLDIKELCPKVPPRKALEMLQRVGGFPEPCLADDKAFYRRWRRAHLDIILRQDMVDLESVRNIQAMETLVELLKRCVGNPVSHAGLARDLECSPKSVKNWLRILESLYVVFPVRPYHRNIGRSILKSPKYYFFDVGWLGEYPAAQLENIVACSLLKELHFLEDGWGGRSSLNYLRNRQGKEIDFYVQVEDESLMVEVKSGDDSPSGNFGLFSKYLPSVKRKIQVVEALEREKTYPDGIEVRNLADWLAGIDLLPDSLKKSG